MTTSNYQETTRLMTSGQVQLEGSTTPTDIQRGMILLSCEGEELGKLAAVIENYSKEVTDLVLGCAELRLKYRLVPVKLINELGEDKITLDLLVSQVEGLPLYSPK